jgi:hypothetical protein
MISPISSAATPSPSLPPSSSPSEGGYHGEKEALRLGAFNGQVFGTTKALKPEVMDVLARIIRTYGNRKLSYSTESHISLHADRTKPKKKPGKIKAMRHFGFITALVLIAVSPNFHAYNHQIRSTYRKP